MPVRDIVSINRNNVPDTDRRVMSHVPSEAESEPMSQLKEIAGVLAEIDDRALIERFLKSILTRNEIREIELRWELVKLLHGGMSQRKISEKLGVSLCKITRGSRELKKNPSAFRDMIEKHVAMGKKTTA